MSSINIRIRNRKADGLYFVIKAIMIFSLTGICLATGNGEKSYISKIIPGMTLEILENFNVKNKDKWEKESIWKFGDHTWGDDKDTGNLVRFNRNNVEFIQGAGEDNWAMAITINREYAERSYSEFDGMVVSDKNYTSGELLTKCKNYRYGMYEVRMRTPKPPHSGFVLAMYTFHDNKATNTRQEIDIELQGQHRDRLTTNFFWSRFEESPEVISPASKFDTRDWHIYSIKWLPGKIQWFVDGNFVRETITEKRLKNRRIIDENELTPDLPASIHFNFWLTSYGETFGGVNSGNRYPLTAEFDWFRFYRLDADISLKNSKCQ